MATYASKTLAVPSSDAAGAALALDGYDGKYVALWSSAVAINATITFAVSYDGGTTYLDLRVLTAEGGFFLDEPCTHLRATTSSFVAGTLVGLVRVSQ